MIAGPFLFPRAVADDRARTPLDLKVDFPDVFADDAEREELDAAEEADADDLAGPAADDGTAHPGNQAPDPHEEREERDDRAEERDEADWLDGKRCNAVRREPQHLQERIVACAGKPLLAGIEHLGRLEPHERDHSTQLEVHLMVLHECV